MVVHLEEAWRALPRGVVGIRIVMKYIEVIVMLISLAVMVVAVGKCTFALRPLFPREFRSFESNILVGFFLQLRCVQDTCHSGEIAVQA